MQYTIVYTKNPEGGFTVQVLELPGCISEGETKQEALINIKEAIVLYVESIKEIAKRKTQTTKNISIDSITVDYEAV